MICIGDICEIEIIDMSHEGEGIGRAEKLTVFVEGAVAGDLVKAKIKQMKKNLAVGEVVEYLKYSPYRIKPICNLTFQCGGCQIQELNYQKQLQIKENVVINALKRIGGFHDADKLVNRIIGMVNPFEYRNKARYPVEIKDGKVKIGFYRKKSHDIVDCERCWLQPEAAADIIKIVRRYIEDCYAGIHDEENEYGIIRFLVVKISETTGEIMVILATDGEKLPCKTELISRLTSDIKGIVSIIQIANDSRAPPAEGERCVTLYGRDNIKDVLGHLTFEISANSFYQVNPGQMKKLYDKVAEYADLNGSEIVFDLYCGVGTIGLYLANKAKKIIGVESVKEAVSDAKRNADLNGIRNSEFIAGKAEQVLPKLYHQGIKADVAVLDPPRKGCDERLLRAIIDIQPKKIIYVSCNPSTLARDLKYLCSEGYELKEAQPVDMFAHSMHVECIVLIKRAESRMK